MKYYIRKGLYLLMAILCVGWVQAQKTIYVSPSGTGDGTSENSPKNLSDAVSSATDGTTIQLAAGTYELASQLVINKAITLEGATTGTTTIKAVEGTWGSSSSTKNLISIVAGQDAEVTLKDLIVQDSKAAGINVQTAQKVTLTNVTSQNNTTAGLLVHAPVEANNFHTSGNTWGGVNIDKGNNGSDTHNYNPSFKFDAYSTFAENTKVWAEKANIQPNAITAPKGWYCIAGKGDDGTTDMYYWGRLIKVGNEVYANGYPIVITKDDSDAGGKKINISLVENGKTVESLNVDGTTTVLYGGSKNVSVQSTSVTINSGKIKTVFGGGHGEDNTHFADVTTANIAVHGGEVSYLMVGGGKYYAKTGTVNITMDNESAIIDEIYAGGYDAGKTGNTITTALDKSNNGVNAVNITLTAGKMRSAIGLGGGQGFTRTGQSKISVSNVTLSGILGTDSNGHADDIDATFTNCKFEGEYKSIASINRGMIDKATIVFDNCTFTDDIEAYIGAGSGWANSDTNGSPVPAVTGSISYEFKNCESVPTVKIGEGLTNANVTVTGAPVQIEKYFRGKKLAEANQYLTAFEIATSKTWTFNNGLTIAEGASLTKEGTLEVGVSSVAELTAAIAAGADKVKMAVGEYNLTGQLTINHTMTLEGTFTESDSTRLVRTTDWTGTTNSNKHELY